jgi:hypothetical protein
VGENKTELYVRLHRAARRSCVDALAAAGKFDQACDTARRWIGSSRAKMEHIIA